MLCAGPLLGLRAPGRPPWWTARPDTTVHRALAFTGTFGLLSHVIFVFIRQDGGPAFPF